MIGLLEAVIVVRIALRARLVNTSPGPRLVQRQTVPEDTVREVQSPLCVSWVRAVYPEISEGVGGSALRWPITPRQEHRLSETKWTNCRSTLRSASKEHWKQYVPVPHPGIGQFQLVISNTQFHLDFFFKRTLVLTESITFFLSKLWNKIA